MANTAEGWTFDESRYKAVWQKYSQTLEHVPDNFCKICGFETDESGNMTARESSQFVKLVELPAKTTKKNLGVRACPSCDAALIKTALS